MTPDKFSFEEVSDSERSSKGKMFKFASLTIILLIFFIGVVFLAYLKNNQIGQTLSVGIPSIPDIESPFFKKDAPIYDPRPEEIIMEETTDAVEIVETVTNTEDIPLNIKNYPQEVVNTKFYFMKDEKVYILNKLGQEPTVLFNDIIDFSLSENKNLYLYAKDLKTDTEPKRTVREVIVQDITGNEIYSFDSDTYNLSGVRDVEWGRGDKYILMNSGTNSSGTTQVADYREKKVVYTFKSVDAKVYWLDAESFVRPYVDNSVVKRPREGGSGTGIKKISLPKGKEKILKKTSDLVDFEIDSFNRPFIYYTKSEIPSADKWEEEDYEELLTKSTWVYNADSLQEEEAEIPTDPIIDEIKEVLPQKDTEEVMILVDYQRHPVLNEWIMLSVSKSTEEDTKIKKYYLANLADIQSTLGYLGEGIGYTW